MDKHDEKVHQMIRLKFVEFWQRSWKYRTLLNKYKVWSCFFPHSLTDEQKQVCIHHAQGIIRTTSTIQIYIKPLSQVKNIVLSMLPVDKTLVQCGNHQTSLHRKITTFLKNICQEIAHLFFQKYDLQGVVPYDQNVIKKYHS